MSRPLIMVLNSDLSSLELMADILADEGYHTLAITADNTAFAQIKLHKPRLVIIELLRTNVKIGLAVLHTMRLHPETARIPVIVTSPIAQLIRDNTTRLQSLDCDLLDRPFNLEALLAMVGKHVTPLA
jgi:CheY-like chemotaxis protein